MSQISLPHTIDGGSEIVAAEHQLNFEEIRDTVNGQLDFDNLTAPSGASLGVNQAGLVRRGASNITTEEARTNTAYGLLATPDRVSNVQMPTNGLMFITYRALWHNSVVDTARAAIHVGGTQIILPRNDLAVTAQTQAAVGPNNTSTYASLFSFAGGLMSSFVGVPHVTTTAPAVVGFNAPSSTHRYELNGATHTHTGGLTAGVTATTGLLVLEMAAGSYDVDVRFKSSSGTVTVKDRVLRVWTWGP